MGDHRADIKLEMTLHGKTYVTSMNISYWADEHGGCDYRVIDWFNECWKDAYARYTFECEEARAVEELRDRERSERLELVRLLKKFGVEESR